MKNYTLEYRSALKFRTILLVTATMIIMVLGASYLHPSNKEWMQEGNFSWTNLLQFVLIDQFLIELISTSLIIVGLNFYAKWMGMRKVQLSFRAMSLFILKLVPFCLLTYVVIAPITTSIRFIYHSFLLGRQSDYLENYFFLNKDIYFSYLIPICLTTLFVLIMVFFNSIQNMSLGDNFFKIIDLKVKTEFGNTVVHSNMISHIKKRTSKYVVVLNTSEEYQINQNISSMEQLLDDDFIRINRSTLINLNYLKDYSFWENEKYIVRLLDLTELNSTRTRIKEIKKRQSEIKLKSYPK
nr:LytTR family DNA-binding domain-containing protein [Allomuricauda sp.]